MPYSLYELLKIEGSVLEFEDFCNMQDGVFPDGSYFKSPVPYKCVVKNYSGTLVLTLNCKAELISYCDRCLDDIVCPVEFEVEGEVSFSPTDDPDKFYAKDGMLDVSELIVDYLNSSIPMKKLCKEHCLGLCPVCGINLNHSSCSCETKEIDPRLEKLRDLF
ncbi:MAG: DUF177 domain-containing protein [Ruminococcaceae bacterium]|nr:DUF177 domain-containing protein [Oscillospiraceae bacterium]